MKQFHPPGSDSKSYTVNRHKPFSPSSPLSPDIVLSVFDFSYDMTFGKVGAHRTYRTGGSHRRKNGEIFANAFQGKLAEFALHEHLKNLGIELAPPDITTYQLGIWDSTDLAFGDRLISIKSTKSFGNLLLLEEDDWDENGIYLPNHTSYDFIFLLRMKPFCEEIMKRERLLYSAEANRDLLKTRILKETWFYDIPGFITSEDLKSVIKNQRIIRKGSVLNGHTVMDASNYYVEAGDLRDAEQIKIFPPYL